jgi:predicted nucleic acid-binding protein
MMIADSDLLIDFLRGRNPGHDRIRVELGTGGLATTSVNAFELASGARASKEQAKVTILLEALTILPVDARAVDIAAGVRKLDSSFTTSRRDLLPLQPATR